MSIFLDEDLLRGRCRNFRYKYGCVRFLTRIGETASKLAIFVARNDDAFSSFFQHTCYQIQTRDLAKTFISEKKSERTFSSAQFSVMPLVTIKSITIYPFPFVMLSVSPQLKIIFLIMR
jgi:hypothetical protein